MKRNKKGFSIAYAIVALIVTAVVIAGLTPILTRKLANLSTSMIIKNVKGWYESYNAPGIGTKYCKKCMDEDSSNLPAGSGVPGASSGTSAPESDDDYIVITDTTDTECYGNPKCNPYVKVDGDGNPGLVPFEQYCKANGKCGYPEDKWTDDEKVAATKPDIDKPHECIGRKCKFIPAKGVTKYELLAVGGGGASGSAVKNNDANANVLGRAGKNITSLPIGSVRTKSDIGSEYYINGLFIDENRINTAIEYEPDDFNFGSIAQKSPRNNEGINNITKSDKELQCASGIFFTTGANYKNSSDKSDKNIVNTPFHVLPTEDANSNLARVSSKQMERIYNNDPNQLIEFGLPKDSNGNVNGDKYKIGELKKNIKDRYYLYTVELGAYDYNINPKYTKMPEWIKNDIMPKQTGIVVCGSATSGASVYDNVVCDWMKPSSALTELGCPVGGVDVAVGRAPTYVRFSIPGYSPCGDVSVHKTVASNGTSKYEGDLYKLNTPPYCFHCNQTDLDYNNGNAGCHWKNEYKNLFSNREEYTHVYENDNYHKQYEGEGKPYANGFSEWNDPWQRVHHKKWANVCTSDEDCTCKMQRCGSTLDTERPFAFARWVGYTGIDTDWVTCPCIDNRNLKEKTNRIIDEIKIAYGTSKIRDFRSKYGTTCYMGDHVKLNDVCSAYPPGGLKNINFANSEFLSGKVINAAYNSNTKEMIHNIMTNGIKSDEYSTDYQTLMALKHYKDSLSEIKTKDNPKWNFDSSAKGGNAEAISKDDFFKSIAENTSQKYLKRHFPNENTYDFVIAHNYDAVDGLITDRSGSVNASVNSELNRRNYKTERPYEYTISPEYYLPKTPENIDEVHIDTECRRLPVKRKVTSGSYCVYLVAQFDGFNTDNAIATYFEYKNENTENAEARIDKNLEKENFCRIRTNSNDSADTTVPEELTEEQINDFCENKNGLFNKYKNEINRPNLSPGSNIITNAQDCHKVSEKITAGGFNPNDNTSSGVSINNIKEDFTGKYSWRYIWYMPFVTKHLMFGTAGGNGEEVHTTITLSAEDTLDISPGIGAVKTDYKSGANGKNGSESTVNGSKIKIVAKGGKGGLGSQKTDEYVLCHIGDKNVAPCKNDPKKIDENFEAVAKKASEITKVFVMSDKLKAAKPGAGSMGYGTESLNDFVCEKRRIVKWDERDGDDISKEVFNIAGDDSDCSGNKQIKYVLPNGKDYASSTGSIIIVW